MELPFYASRDIASQVDMLQLGQTTRLSAMPHGIDRFRSVYSGATRDDIRQDNGNIGEKVGSQGRPVQETNQRACPSERRSRLGEANRSHERGGTERCLRNRLE